MNRVRGTVIDDGWNGIVNCLALTDSYVPSSGLISDGGTGESSFLRPIPGFFAKKINNQVFWYYDSSNGYTFNYTGITYFYMSIG